MIDNRTHSKIKWSTATSHLPDLCVLFLVMGTLDRPIVKFCLCFSVTFIHECFVAYYDAHHVLSLMLTWFFWNACLALYQDCVARPDPIPNFFCNLPTAYMNHRLNSIYGFTICWHQWPSGSRILLFNNLAALKHLPHCVWFLQSSL